MSDKHIISILLENEAGVLSRVAGLFSARGYNIESLTVARTDDPTMSRMTIVTLGADDLALQIRKQLDKLVDVISVVDLSECQHIEQEMLLAKVACPTDDVPRARIDAFVSTHSATVISHSDGVCVMGITAPSHDIDAFIRALDEWRILEIVRSGTISLECGETTLKAMAV